MVLINSKPKPFHSFNKILIHSDTFVICHAKIIFRSNFILIGSFTIPLCCFNRVFGYASTDGIANTKITLRSCMTLFSSLAIPVHRLFEILGHAPAVEITHTEMRFPVRLLCDTNSQLGQYLLAHPRRVRNKHQDCILLLRCLYQRLC